MQDARGVAIDGFHQAGVCALSSPARSHFHVQQGQSITRVLCRMLTQQSHESVGPAVSTLKKLAILEPDLVMPAIIERTVSSLEGLEEVCRSANRISRRLRC